MKKFLLPFVAISALMSTTAVYADGATFSLTEDWKALKTETNPEVNALEGLDRDRNWNAENVTTKHCVRYATAMNGKIYFVNMMTMSIAEFTPQGEIKDLYKLPALEGDDFYGTALTHDDAGHFLVGHYFTDQKSSYIWTIFDPETGEFKHIDVTPSAAELPAYGRIDCVGRVVGDLTKEAYLYVSSRSWNADKAKPLQATDIKIYCVNFVNTGSSIKDVEAYGEFTPQIYLAAAYNSVAQPSFSNIEALNDFIGEGGNLYDTFYSYSTAYGSAGTLEDYWPMFYRFENGSLTKDDATKFGSFAATTGFDTFELNGNRYFVINYLSKDAAENPEIRGTMDVAVFDKDFNKLAAWSNSGWKAGVAYTSVVAEPVDDTTANIYSYACAGSFNGQKYGNSAICGAKLTFKAEGVTGIEDIVTEEADAAPVYYNLQGVEVANPENGVYIVRRGSRVSKEMIR